MASTNRVLVALGVVAICLALPGRAAAQDVPEVPPADVMYPDEAPAAEVQVADEYGAADEAYYSDDDPSALTEFRDELSPHGDWVDDGRYGTVWVPNVATVGTEFAPYRTGGRWAVADSGDWVWVSDYSWGAIPFHYGRWVWIPARGWAWIPGREYAPSWVVWRTGSVGYDYVGWAPMAPSFIWVNGVAVAFGGVGVLPFWYCHSHYLFSPYWRSYIVRDHYHARRIHSNTRVHHGHHGGRGHAGGGGSRHPASPHVKASPTPGGSPGASPAASPRRAAALSPRPISPSFDDARIPESARPSERVRANERALAAARRPSSLGRASLGGASSAQGGRPVLRAQGAPAPARYSQPAPSRVRVATPAQRAPATRAPLSRSRSTVIPRQPRFTPPSRPTAPSRGYDARSPGARPSHQAAPPRRTTVTRRAPAGATRPVTRPAPSRAAPPSRSYTRPSRSVAPPSRSVSRPSRSTPSRSVSRPSRSVSRPSAPSRSPSRSRR